MTESDRAGQAGELGLSLSSKQQEQFDDYQRLLLDWNQNVNLTAITDPRQVQIRHFYDSLTAVSVLGDLNGQSVIDIGTGAGFPGLPLKIAIPELILTLVESVGKKTRFLEAIVDDLGLDKVTVIHARAEEIGQDEAHREQYDWAIARAVAHLATLSEYLLPLARVGGHALAFKSGDVAGEVAESTAAISQLGGGEVTMQESWLPGQDAPHYHVIVEKLRPTDPRYPRRAGMPAKRPLR